MLVAATRRTARSTGTAACTRRGDGSSTVEEPGFEVALVFADDLDLTVSPAATKGTKTTRPSANRPTPRPPKAISSMKSFKTRQKRKPALARSRTSVSQTIRLDIAVKATAQRT